MMIDIQSTGSASPTSLALNHSGEEIEMNYPKSVAQEIAVRRPDLCANDAVSVVLTADPTLTADEAIAILAEATMENINPGEIGG